MIKDISELQQTVGTEHALEALTRSTRVIQFPASTLEGNHEDQEEGRKLPAIKAATDLFQTIFSTPDVVVAGLLHQGSKMVLGGGSKSYKTFCLVDLAISVSTGMQWWGMDTTKGRVLYINLEIQEGFFKDRLDAVATAKGIGLEAVGNLDVWTLRGFCTDLSEMSAEIIDRVSDRGYSLIIIDPIYKAMGGRDENSAGDINSMLNEVERLAVQSGAAVVFGAHFSKGNQAGKESIDRISGSGVFARDPDSILVMTKHEQESTFTIDATLRNFKPIEPFCIQWKYPLMIRDEQADPTHLKVAGNKVTKYTPQQLLEVLADQELTSTAWYLATAHKTGMSKRTFQEKLAKIKEDKTILVKTDEDKWKAVNPIIKNENIGAEVQ